MRHILLLLATAGFIIGAAKVENNQKDSKSAPASKHEAPVPYSDIKRFTSAYAQIKNFYVDKVTSKKLFEDAIRGMLSGLDPHSSYLDEEEFHDLQMNTSGQFSGLGLEVTNDDGLLRVITPLDDSPAAKAGIKPKDLISRIDNVPVKGLTLREAIKKMRGSEGSKITLAIVRDGQKAPMEFVIKRSKVKIQSIKSKMLDPGYGYVRISQFQSLTAKEFKAALLQLQQKAGGQMKGLLLDLRNNPGGLLDSAVAISDALLDKKSLNRYKGRVVFTKGRVPGTEFSIKSNPLDLLKGAPIVILINAGSASGSEIVAGALKDYKRAVLVGTQSFGKGSVQTVIPLEGNRGLKLTTALYYTPSGRSIQAEGIKPDITVEDLKFEKSKKDATAADEQPQIKEANLNRHFENKQVKKLPLLPSEKLGDKGNHASFSKEQEKLALTDYQLFEALNILKTVSITNKV